MAKVEEMIRTGRAPYPVERTLLVSGAELPDIEGTGAPALETPELNVRYRAPKESQFAGAGNSLPGT